MIAGLFLLSLLGFAGGMINLFTAKPAQQRTAQRLVFFFGYCACLFMLVPVFAPVGGGV